MFNLIRAYPRHTVFFDRKISYLALSTYVKGALFDDAAIEELERLFAVYVGTARAVAAPSGRAALSFTLSALDFPKGSQVILSAYNFPPVVATVINNGLIPVFVDIDRLTFNIDPKKIEEKISSRTKAIIVTHMFGNPCDMEAIRMIAKRYGLKIVEDATHAFGGSLCGKNTGSLGDIAFFSLSSGKNIAAFGGGVATTSDIILADKIRNLARIAPIPQPRVFLRNVLKTMLLYQLSARPVFNLMVYPFLRLFDNFAWKAINRNSVEKKYMEFKLEHAARFSSLQAKVCIYQLSRIERYKEIKKKISGHLDGMLMGQKSFFVQHTQPGAENCKLYYVVCAPDKSQSEILDIRQMLFCKGVDTQFLDMHDCSRIDKFKSYACDCPVAAAIAPAVFEIPSDISLGRADLEKIADFVKICL